MRQLASALLNLVRSRPMPGRGVLVCVGTALACASSPPPAPLPNMAWPEPPLRTRIVHVRSIYGAQDVQAPATGWERAKRALGAAVGRSARQLQHPAAVAVSPDGNVVYVSDFAQGIVHVFDLKRHETRYFGSTQPLMRPFGLALSEAGNLYVVEQQARQIRVFGPSGETLQIIRSERLIRPVGVALDEARGRLYVADPAHQSSREHFVRVFALDGRYLGEVGEGRGTHEGQLLFPTYVSVADDGRVFVSDTMNARVSVFDADGHFLRTFGERGDGFGLFDKPKGIALDSFGNLYVADSSWSNVQIFDPQGRALLYFGGRGSYPGLFHNPTGLAIAAKRNRIFVADYLNHRLSVYQLVNTGPDEADVTDEGGRS